jgi:uncharacterized protein (UPF0548 family)
VSGPHRHAYGRVDVAAALADLSGRAVNYQPDEVDQTWNHDSRCTTLGHEPKGPPVADGLWHRACRVVRDYQFPPPSRLRAVYDPDTQLLGRDMLLEGRFYALHFYFGVRITETIDRVMDDGVQAWGWAYETLEGHVERGKMSYQVLKQPDTGEVEFAISAYSRGVRRMGLLERIGWPIFGRRTQLGFYRDCGTRMQRLSKLDSGRTSATHNPRPDGLVLAPADVTLSVLDRVAVHRLHPGA